MANIIVIGAGIGGLTAAISLRQAGHSITLYERRKKSDMCSGSSGAGVILWPNGCKVLDKLGLFDKLRNISGRLENHKVYNIHNELLEQLSLQDIERKNGYSCCPVLYKELYAILFDYALKLDCHFVYDRKVLSIHKFSNSTATQVRLDNNEFVDGDLIVGSDGRMQSVVRQYVVGDNRPIYQNYVNWVGFVESKKLLANFKDIADYRGDKKRFGIVPVGENKVYWAGCQVLPSGLGVPKEGNKNKLISLFEKWPEPIMNLLHETPDENIKHIEVYDLDPTENWIRDNVVLLGDAAHASLPTSSQGACQAMIDASTLTESLGKCSDISDALQDYQRKRIPITSEITLNARRLASKIFELNS